MISKNISLALLVGVFVVIFTLSSHTAMADPASASTAPVVYLQEGFPVVYGASSKIVRNDNGVTVSVSTTVDPGTYTMTMLLWNDPNQCNGGGGLVCNPQIDPPDCVLFTAGHVVGNNGTLNYSGHRRVSDTSGRIGGVACESGLTNPHGAAVHLGVTSHGPKIPGQVNLQISTPAGGCPPNDCPTVQAAAHELQP